MSKDGQIELYLNTNGRKNFEALHLLGYFLFPHVVKCKGEKKVSDHHGHLKLPYRVEFSIPFHPYFLMVMSGEKIQAFV